MEQTLKNLASASLLFLVITGGIHISSTFLLIQGNLNPILYTFFQSFDLPFLISALSYGSAKLSLTLEEATGKGKLALTVCGIFSMILLSLALFVNFAFPDAKFFG